MMQWKNNNSRFTIDDMRLLESYSVFLSISLEKAKLKTLAQLGSTEVEMQNWIPLSEQQFPAVPTKMWLSEADAARVFGLDFNVDLFQGIDVYRTVFALFEHFGLLAEFSISAETMFRFMHELKYSYNQVPYHNWNHAVDLTQFVAFLLIRTGLDKVLTKFEVFSLLVVPLPQREPRRLLEHVQREDADAARHILQEPERDGDAPLLRVRHACFGELPQTLWSCLYVVVPFGEKHRVVCDASCPLVGGSKHSC